MSDEPSYVPGRLADLRKDVSRSGRPGADFVVEVVDRLATHPDMATIWKALGKLPDSQERESKLVDRACIAYGVTFSLFPKRSEVDGKNSLSSIDNTPAFMFNGLARAATDAATMMKDLSAYFAAEIVGYDKAIAVLDKVTIAAKQKASRRFFRSMVAGKCETFSSTSSQPFEERSPRLFFRNHGGRSPPVLRQRSPRPGNDY